MPIIAGGINAEAVRFAGVDLKATYGVYAEVMDGVASLPPVRGQNLLIPYQTGKRWVQKFYDERPIVITGSMINVISRADFYAKLDGLKQLLQIGTGEKMLEVQRQDGSYRYVMAEVRNTLGLQWMTFPTRSSTFSIEFIASDPLWYGSALEASQARQPWTLDSGVFLDDGAHWLDQTSQYFAQTLTSQITNVEATNSGDTVNRKPVFLFAGVMASCWIYNQRNGYVVYVGQPANFTMVVDCGAQRVTIDGVLVLPNLVTIGAGQSDWMHLEPGENTLQINLGTATPVVGYQAQYSPAYL